MILHMEDLRMRLWKKSTIVLLVLTLFFSVSLSVLAKQKTSILPKKSPNSDKWRIAYYEGGQYADYDSTLLATINGLMELGWIDKEDTEPLRDHTAKQLWQWLTESNRSKFLEFVGDAFYSLDWDAANRETESKALIDRVNKGKDIDLIISMGTWSGQDLANNRHKIPTLVMSASNAVTSGIVVGANDSGFDHVHAHLSPKRDENQIRLFHDIVEFKRLGVIYENSVAGRSYAAIDQIEKIAAERGFEIVRCFAKSDIPDVSLREQEYISCFERLATQTDAIYVTIHGGASDKSIPKLVDIAIKNNIPTFSQSGSNEVESGILLSLSTKDFRYVGLFEAAIIAKVLNGAKPRDLEQVFEESPNLAVNLKTAELIGYLDDLRIDVLAAADEFYREIEKPM